MTQSDHGMAENMPGGTKGPGTPEQRLDALLRDLERLRGYLEERGSHTYELAQRFMENARRDSSSRAYDERQATMLEYQHYIWHEIAGRIEQLLVAYGEPEQPQPPAKDA